MGWPITELRLAFAWTCDACGRDNFERGVHRELPPAELLARCAHAPVDVVTGHELTPPGRVACPHCGAVFKAVTMGLQAE